MTWLMRLVGSSCLLLGCSSECTLDDDIHLFAGDGAIDCGTADESHDRSKIDQCATDAFGAGKAFIARYAAQGTDSKLVTALASNTAGKLEIFRWDSAPCGGSSCSPVTDVQSCEGPSVSMQTSAEPNTLPIDCESLGLAQRICG